jgi:hypothetical protein
VRRARRGAAVGQWGSRLFVSTPPAEQVCRRVWDVPAELASITFDEGVRGDALCVDAAPTRVSGGDGVARETIRVRGWAATRSGGSSDDAIGRVPVLWTPSIKALWAPLVPLPPPADAPPLPLHPLRLSASSVRVRGCGQPPSDALGVPLPFGLTVDGLRIEIGRQTDEPL